MLSEIKADRLILRSLRLEDAEAMFEYASDPEVVHFTSWEVHKNVEDSKKFIESSIQAYGAKNIGPYGICLKTAPNQVIGTVGLRMPGHEFEGELACALSRKHWRQGIMFEAASALLAQGFTKYNFKRIFATCAEENIASRNLLKKLRMNYEGCLRVRPKTL